jgi:nicotinate-nucleotide adenylyltransferase
MTKQDDLHKIGLFGGTFDPVHHGHIILSEWVCDALGLDKIILIPNFIHPFLKRSGVTEARHRLTMLRLAAENYPQMEVNSIEVDRKDISYSVDAIRYFAVRYKNAELYYLIGADNLPEFKDWKEPQEILRLARLVVFNRQSKETGLFPFDASRLIQVDNPQIALSSTMIRERIRSGKLYQSLVLPAVAEYIRANQLYTG